MQSLLKTFNLHLNDKVMTVTPFRDLSFSVLPGEFLGITGQSGIGKSSILKCIYRTYLPTGGKILFESSAYGRLDLVQAPERQISLLRKGEISYVSQFLKVIPRISALDTVAERRLISGCDLEEARRRAGELLEALRIPSSLWAAYPATFSGGEQQRVNLARAFIARPRLLILDEPTASLDSKSKQSVLSLLLDMKMKGTAMIGVFHDLEMMKLVADKILDLNSAIEVQNS